MNAKREDLAVLKILVVDDQVFQRRLITETLRSAGRVQVEHVESVEQALLALGYVQPDILIADWDVAGGQGLALVTRVRAGEAGDGFKALPVIMVAAQGSMSAVERARNAGIDELVVRPFSTTTLWKRVNEVRARRRDFIESTRYTGPCRRRRARSGDYDGPRRRLFDSADKNADAPEVQIRKGLARMYVENIKTQLAALQPGSGDAMRDLCLTCGQLSALASDMKDRLLMSGASSLFNYLKGLGAEGLLNAEVVGAHLDAILQLAELPNHQVELRQTVTQQLTVMVSKKLRQAGSVA
jgi:DNA-binding response OmpR family regulator